MLALTLEQIVHERRLEDIAEGYAKGYAEGYAKGYAEGIAEGKQELAAQLTTLKQLLEGREDKDDILSYAFANTSEITDLINRYQNLVISG